MGANWTHVTRLVQEPKPMPLFAKVTEVFRLID